MANAGIYYDIDTNGGQSGCPVYIPGDKNKVVGIHKAYDPLKKLNVATMITKSVMAVLKVWIE